MTDSRKFSRVAFDAESNLTRGGETLPAQLIDISLKGALIEFPGSTAPAAGDQALLEIRLLGTDAVIRMSVRVAHVSGIRLGLVCLSIDLESISHLRRLLELNSGDPHLVERELSAML